MCGIAGIFYFDHARQVDKSSLQKMTDVIHHRGPDDEGFFIENNVGLGFRRLSIIDLSAGHQPIANEDNTVWTVFNGEIYNFKELTKSLEAKGHIFKTKSDSETLVHLYEEYGDNLTKYIRGMFAFAIYDTRKKRLVLARDRVGIKPLYYYLTDQELVFGSELKQIKAVVKNKLSVNHKALSDYFTYGYIAGEKTIYNEINKLAPAHLISIDNSGLKPLVQKNKYWNLVYQPDNALTENEWQERIDSKLTECINMHLVSDVPLGAFLSGGVDSSAVVAIMASQLKQPINTFSIGFKEKKYNELDFARIVSKKYKTNHRELIVEPSSIEMISQLASMYDEPFADSSAIPTYYVSKFAGEYVKVVLSGDGGDELFAGYKRYLNILKFEKLQKRLTPQSRHFFSLAIKLLPNYNGFKDKFYYLSKPYTDIAAYPAIFKNYERNGLLNTEILHSLSDYRSENERLKILKSFEGNDLITNAGLLDVETYMTDDILTKVDRASMANSIEARVPLLDHEFIELAFQIPSHFKIHKQSGKHIFKKMLEKYLDKEILYRKKQGFGLPLSSWFNNELEPYTNEKLLNKNSRIYNYINYNYVESILKAHKKNHPNTGEQIWSLLFFETWLEQN